MLKPKLFSIGLTCGISTLGLAYDRGDYEEKNIFQNKELEIRYFGWSLLGLWIGAIIYMTRDFFFPSIFGKKDLPSKSPAEDVRRFSHMMTIVEEAEEFSPPPSSEIIKKRLKTKGGKYTSGIIREIFPF